jgi:poly(3-hydroxybutyrate) depolymerase
MKIKAIIFGAATLVVGLPLAMIVAAIATISVLDQTNGSLDSSGQSREYLLHVPGSYDPTRPTPLVISLHGGATWPAQQMNLSRWNQLSDEDGFIVVYPSGTPQLLDVVRIWHTFELDAELDRDVRYIADLIDTLEAAYHIDSARIYAMAFPTAVAWHSSCRAHCQTESRPWAWWRPRNRSLRIGVVRLGRCR